MSGILCCVHFRGTNLNHYEVIRGSDGYVINVDNKVFSNI